MAPRLRILAAEDARVDDVAVLVDGVASADVATQVAAVRALGRLERPELAPRIAVAFASPHEVVRVAAAQALAQSAWRGPAADARRELTLRLRDEPSPAVRGALALAIGRLTYASASEVAEAAQNTLAAGAIDPLPPLDLLRGLTLGLESLARRHQKIGRITTKAVAALRVVAVLGRSGDPDGQTGLEGVDPLEVTRLRRAAVAALAATDPNEATLNDALGDLDAEVRRTAYRARIGAAADPAPLIAAGLDDEQGLVRLEAILAAARRAGALPCARLHLLFSDPVVHVALTAIETAGRICAGDRTMRDGLAAIVDTARQPAEDLETAEPEGEPTSRAPSWHWRARALVALAAVDPDAARQRLPRMMADSTWQVRVAAARAAAILGDANALDRLVVDMVDNVRDAALGPLVGVRGDRAVPAVVAALGRDDPQLVLTAARQAARFVPDSDLVAPLIEAFDRLTASRRETSRDPRLALLDALERHGDRSLADRITSILQDFDPVVADRAASLLTTWTGTAHAARPRRLPAEPRPTADDLERMTRVRVVLHLESAGAIELRLAPAEAPLNGFRFLRLAESGHYDGLTFHRVVPGFVVQGGSPGANEYWGAAAFSRDEVGRSNLRGTVGVSTRGRDTGDGQFYINLVDNIRLDDDYTVFADVVDGMDIVDGLLEGATITRVEVRSEVGGVSGRATRSTSPGPIH